MKNKQLNWIAVSIIIVNYKVKQELFECLDSIVKSKPKVSYEVIVVDNNSESKIEKELKEKFSNIKYVKSKSNLGYGGGNNLGASYVQGEYLFFLNPDTKILDGALDNLYNFFIKNNNAGAVSPIFLDKNLVPFKSQGSKELTPKTILFSQSLMRKVFPDKNIYSDNVLDHWDMRQPLITDSVPGAAIMINSKLFKKIGGFDEKFFLYFEENDISKRIIDLGYKLYIVPSAKIVHFVGRSIRNIKNMENIYSKSRYLYLKKHYGLLKAIFTQAVLSINKTSIFLLLILISAFFLRIINIANDMPFIGDQGWFYLSAKDMVVNGRIPLIGIASSHPWLHQGPLWTYMLAGTLWLFGFNPVNGAYLTIALGTLSVLLIYIIGTEMFSKRIGLISALLYATSPLVVSSSRIPYHTSLIPLFTLLYIFSLYKWIKGNSIFFPLSIFFLAVLYNFELATSTLWGILFVILMYGIWKKKEWIKKLLNKKILIYSIAAFIIPMFPILIYDFNHNFPQTIKFAAWIGYKILRFFGYPAIHGEDELTNSGSIFSFSFHFYQYLIFAANNIVAFVIFVFSLIALVLNLVKKKIREVGFTLLTLWIFISLIGYFVNKTPSDAYLPILFPALIFLTAFSFDKIMEIKVFFIPAVLFIAFIVFINSYFVISSEYSSKTLNFSKRLVIAREIVQKSSGKDYNIAGVGDGSQFESFTMNYEYLTWWLGHPPSKCAQKFKFIIQENKSGAFLIKNE